MRLIFAMVLFAGCTAISRRASEIAEDVRGPNRIPFQKLIAGEPPADKLDANALKKQLRRIGYAGKVDGKAWPLTARLVALDAEDRHLPEPDAAKAQKDLVADHTCFRVSLDVDTYNGDDAKTGAWTPRLDLGSETFDMTFERPTAEATPTNKKRKEWTNEDTACAAKRIALPDGFDLVLVPKNPSAKTVIFEWRADVPEVAH